ncbi:MAG: ParA family protein [Ardenticatenaceae bacterium]
MNTRIIAIVSQKGGVGKTALAHNLGYELSQAGQRVLLVDFDPQADLTSSVGLDLEEERLTVYDAMSKPSNTAKCVVNIRPNLDLLPSHLSLAGAEIEFTMNILVDRGQRLSNALRPIAENYDYILVDAPPSLGFFTVNALIACDGVLVPLQCERLAQKALGYLLGIMEELQQRNPELRIIGIALTFYDRRVSISEQIEAETREEFGEFVFDTTVPRNVEIMKASDRGLAVATHAPKSSGAAAYHALAQEVLND